MRAVKDIFGSLQAKCQGSAMRGAFQPRPTSSNSETARLVRATIGREAGKGASQV